MAVQDQIPYNQHTGNGVTTVFAFSFLLLLQADLKVYLDGVLQASGYTVSGVGNPTGGTVTFSVAPANGVVVLLDRDIPLERLTDYQDGGDLLADTLNRDMDRLWMAIQGESEINARQVTLPQGSTVDAELPAPSASAVLRVNAAGDGFEWATIDDATAITLPLSIAQGGTSATTAAAARTALGLGTAAVLNSGTGAGNVPLVSSVLMNSLFTTTGDIAYATGVSTPARLGIGTARQVLRVNAGATAPSWADQITVMTPAASTSGTSIDFTSIPAGVKRVKVLFTGVSTSGTSPIIVQIGPSGGVETSGYSGGASLANGANATVTSAAGFVVSNAPAAANAMSGCLDIDLENISANTWVAKGTAFETSSTNVCVGAGSKSIAGVLSRIRITTAGGADTFDAGEINVTYS